ncbi:4-amino-4-deoxy-L-arabinose-phosphoundecaprenol flippase subunit ArnF [Biostraticola tofi]|uniref:Probable 4-amino-4-deoxy-L-arabinose-phosphoundecaprenol flippase subunit ArnF n=1 Tax=Biostraticola tofi TaxID=466109 RepID=A0A4R3YZZ7_9GAMM|nr:4-amino-4-deoxy-L-arabinose-phosphoundecaprenol flippase subunit ArnF [Biostraticola tofi]TCV98922.1 undecaprenyl phosphate-alpha-L-ara4N flippase subunit ArnF [Biostraticola tofi]
MNGYGWGLFSAFLVTLAQLMMKWGMSQLPLLSVSMIAPALLPQYPLPLLAVLAGSVAYLVSMGCWFMALRCLPLNRAYSLVSLSYVLVYLTAILLPMFNEHATLLKSMGAMLIVVGIMLINPGGNRD